jgi:hypothetical protein
VNYMSYYNWSGKVKEWWLTNSLIHCNNNVNNTPGLPQWQSI